jgi:hypothetical protein
MPTLSSDIGLSFEVSERFREVPELAVGPVCLVASVDPWDFPDAFRPNITVEVDGLAPDRATVVQLSALTIAAQMALGRHVIACELWMRPGEQEPGEGTGRRIISVYPAMGTTVVQLQYVWICGNRSVTISAQCGAGNYPGTSRAFDLAVRSLRCDFEDPHVVADPSTMPRLDPWMLERGDGRAAWEYLGGVRAAQPFRSPGPMLAEDQITALRKGKLRRGTDARALQAGGFVDEDRQLSELGAVAHAVLESPMRRLGVGVRCDGVPDVSAVSAFLQPDSAVVVADVPPGGAGRGQTVEVIATGTLVDVLVRWLGLAPAWSFSVSEDGQSRELDGRVLDARLADPAAPPPADANPGLARMWGLPWQEVSLGSTRRDTGVQRVITTTESGSYLLTRDGSSSGGSLTPLPASQYLVMLMRFAGFEI